MQKMAVAGRLLCLWAALTATAESLSCSSLPDIGTLYFNALNNLGIINTEEQPPPGYLCQAQGSLANTYSAVTFFGAYLANSPPPGIPQNGFVVVDVVCTGAPSTWMSVNQTAVNNLPSTTLRRDCHTCGVEHMATSFCAVCSPACSEGLQRCTGPSPADCCNFFLNNNCVSSCGFENRPNSTMHCVPTAYLSINITSGEQIDPGSPSTTIITDGMFNRVSCRVGGPLELTSEVTPTLSWSIDLTNTSITTFSSLSDGIPAGNYSVPLGGGNDIMVEVKYGMSAAEVIFAPQFAPELQGMYKCTGNSTSEGALSLVANLITANPYFALRGDNAVRTGFPTRKFTVPLTAQYRDANGSQITAGLMVYYTSNGANVTGTITLISSGSYSISFPNDLPGVVSVTVLFTAPGFSQRSLVLTVYSYGVTLPSTDSIEVMAGDNFSIACTSTVPGVPVRVTTPGGMMFASPYVVPSAVSDQSGVYLCRADFTDIPNSVQANLTVTVLVFPSNVAIHTNFQFLLPLAIVNDFSLFDSSSSIYTYSCVGFGSHSNLQWRLGGQLITNTSPETSEPFYVEAVSTREVRLVVFSARVGQLGMMLQCVSQSGATASMRLTLDEPFYMLETTLPTLLSLGQLFTLQFTYAANSTGIDQPSVQTNLFSVLTTNTSTMLMTTVQRDTAYNYSIMLSAAQQFINENIQIRYNGSSMFVSPVINVSITVPNVTFTSLVPPHLLQNELATLTCIASNSLSPISWFNEVMGMTQRLTTPPYNYTNSITRNQVMFRPYQADLRGQPGSSYPPLSLNLSPVQSVDVDLQPQLRIPTMFSCTVCSDDSDSLSACTAAPQRTQNIHTLFSPVTIFNDGTQMYNNSIVVTSEGLFLQCMSTAGNGDLMWRSSNPDLQQLLMSGNTSIGPPYNLRITKNSLWSIELSETEGISFAALAGSYDCMSQESGVFSTMTLVDGNANNFYLRRQTEAVVTVSLGAPLLLTFKAASRQFNGNPLVSSAIFSQLRFTPPNNDSVAPPSTCQSEENLANVLPQAYEISPYNYAFYQQATGVLNAGVYTVQQLPSEQSQPPLVNETVTVQITTPTVTGSPARITARVGDTVTFRCTPSDDRIRLRWFRRTFIPNNPCSSSGFPNVGEMPSNLYIEICPNQGPAFSFDDNIKQHALTVNVDGKFGVVSCFVRDPSVQQPYSEPSAIGVEMSLDAIRMCAPDFSGGLAWPPIEEGMIATLPCSAASSRFSSTINVRRPCVDGVWSQVDYSGCTLTTGDMDPFLILWFRTDFTEGPAPTVEQVIAQQSAMEAQIVGRFENEGHNVTVTRFTTEQIVTIPVVFIAMEVTTPSLTTLSPSLQSFINSGLILLDLNSGVRIAQFNRGWVGFQNGNFCECFTCRVIGVTIPDQEGPIFPPMMYMRTCSGVSASPCDCLANGTCTCSEPFVGNGRLCTLDSDYDLYPDQALPDQPPDPNGDSNTTSCSGSPKYCQQDNCISTYNPTQDPLVCNPQPLSQGAVVCPNETDSTWRVNWPRTAANTTSTQPCPNAPAVAGLSTRQCDGNGVWGPVSVSVCVTRVIRALLAMTDELISTQQNNIPIVAEQAADIIDELAMVTMSDGTNSSQLPQDLESANMILESTLQVLQQSLENGTQVNTTGIIQLLSNLLDQRNLPGWTGLQQQNSTSASEQLLDNAEVYGRYVARALQTPGAVSVMSRPNIALRAERVAVSASTGGMAIQFPLAEDLQNFSSPLGTMEPASITIPAALLRERATAGSVTVSNLLLNNIQSFLSSSNISANIQPRTVVLSSQVDVQRGSSAALQDDPVRMNFTVLTNNFSDPRCVFWSFSQPRGNGQWSSDGVTTLYVNGSQQVLCNSTHLTSFAVLVDVSGLHTEINPVEARALSIVSYIGCTVSIICLILTVIFFLSFGKKLFVSVNNFVHLNLSAALLAGLIVFVAGIETAINDRIGCAAVAALLHYFFLSVFCWMLCEGVMLYLMLVVVFSSLSKKWWFFLLLGWVPPLVPVVIGLAAASDQYGVTDENGTLLFCWLSTDGRPVIWAFAAPMIAIVLVNTVFLVLVMISLVRNKIRRNKGVLSDKENRIDLVKSIIKASVILLPLLGLTWIIGLFSVNVHTTAFAWIFAICNSIQGVLIFFFHVIRNERVWNKLTKRYSTWKSSSRYHTGSTGETSSTLGKSPIWKRKNDHSRGTLPSEKGVEILEKTPVPTDDKSADKFEMATLSDLQLDENLDEKPSAATNGAHSNHHDDNLV